MLTSATLDRVMLEEIRRSPCSPWVHALGHRLPFPAAPDPQSISCHDRLSGTLHSFDCGVACNRRFSPKDNGPESQRVGLLGLHSPRRVSSRHESFHLLNQVWQPERDRLASEDPASIHAASGTLVSAGASRYMVLAPATSGTLRRLFGLRA